MRCLTLYNPASKIAMRIARRITPSDLYATELPCSSLTSAQSDLPKTGLLTWATNLPVETLKSLTAPELTPHTTRLLFLGRKRQKRQTRPLPSESGAQFNRIKISQKKLPRRDSLKGNLYIAGRPICSKVLKIMFWEVPSADWLIL